MRPITKCILFTGGGSAGHVVPNMALINCCLEQKISACYMGSYDGIEKKLIASMSEAVPYYGIASGKLRRYISPKNLADPFKVLLGIGQAWWYLGKIRPALVFSKGGFVAFPVVFAAWLRGISVIAHESDLTPGLANRLSFPFVKKIAMTWKSNKKEEKMVVTGTPLRESLFQGDANIGRQLCGFDNDKPCILIIGGGSGAMVINEAVRQALPQLLKTMNVIHCCGQGKRVDSNVSGYKQFEYVNEELLHLYACAELVISRAGANTVYEILALQKPALLIPLSLKASRGDQILNANFLASQELCVVLEEEKLNSVTLIASIEEVFNQRDIMQEKMRVYGEMCKIKEGTKTIMSLIRETMA